MDNKETYDTIIVLGGGRYNNGDLTPLSIQRLERGYQLYSKKVAGKIFAMGGYYSTYSKKAIHFKISSAQLRREFLINLGVKSDDIIMVENGRDTIGEAFASRKSANELQMKKVLIVTSDKHMKRALWVFRRIFGKGFEINGESVPCGNLLIEDEEKRYYDATVTYFQRIFLIQ